MRAVAQKRSAVDPSSREARSRLAAMVTRLLEHWELTASEQAEVLGLSAGGLVTLKVANLSLASVLPSVP